MKIINLAPSDTAIYLFNNGWNLIVLLTTSFLAIILPLDLDFEVLSHPTISVLNKMAYVIYLIDIFICLFGSANLISIVTNQYRSDLISKTYLKKWFLLDILSLLPFHIIFNNPYLMLLRLLKIPKVIGFMQRLKYFEVQYTTTITLLYSLFWLVHLSHWVSCGWLKLIKHDTSIDDFSNYIRALYWSITTLTTVGFGDVTPDMNDNYQLIYTMIVQLMGIGIYGYVIGNVVGIFSQDDPAKVTYLDNIEKLRILIRSRRLPPQLQRKIRDYFTYIWQNRLGYNEGDFLAKLPENLRFDLNKHLKNEIIEKIDIFRGAGEDFIEEVAMFLEPELITPGDIIFEKGDVGGAMYFLVSGVLEVLDEEGNIINTIQNGQFFGEIALFMKTPRTATIKSVTYSDLYKLKKEKFDTVISNFPKIAKKIKKEAILRQKRY